MNEFLPGAMVKHLRTISPQGAIGMFVGHATAYQLETTLDPDKAVADAARQVREVLAARGVDRTAWLAVVSKALQLRLRIAGLSPSTPSDRQTHAPSAIQRRVDYFAAADAALRAL